MKILAIETATEACSAALYIDGSIIHRYKLAPREHSRLILPMMDDLLNEAGISLTQLDTLAFGRGPGSFTGLRIAAGIIQGSALGADLPVVPVSTLAALAQDAIGRFSVDTIFVGIDARMGEIYWGLYGRNKNNLVALVGEEVVSKAIHVGCPDDIRGAGVGSGWKEYSKELREHLGERVVAVDGDCFPKAGNVAILAVDGFEKGLAVAAETAIPVYLRDNVAKKSVVE